MAILDTEDIQLALASSGLPNIRVVADPDDIARLERAPGCRVRFVDAIPMALKAFLEGDTIVAQGHASALEIVRAAPEAFGLGLEPTQAEITSALRRMLADDPHARIVLLSPGTIRQPVYRFLPDRGESITENWVFRILVPSCWPALQWAIIDIRGKTPPYSYGLH